MICPRCQTLNSAQAKFCSNCGQALDQGAAQKPAPTPTATAGERKLVTVLFADVVGSTAMAERLDPELVTEVMNGAFAFMNAAVARYDGLVARLMGDAVLAIFGAPASHEDDPERAVRAGLEIQTAAEPYTASVRQQYGVEFNLRVGVHTGLAVLDQVGDRVRAEYTAMGDTPNVAARMQSAAAPGTVLVSESTYRLTRHAFDFEPRGPLEVKGKSAPVEAWRVVAPKATRASARGLEGMRAPLVGREAELHTLRARLSALRPGGTGALITLTGEAGLGKSRLMAELRQWSAAGLGTEGVLTGPGAPPTWLEGHCISYGRSISYLPWRQVVRQSVGAQETDPDADVRRKLNYAACECCRLPGGDLVFLEAMLAVASEQSLKEVLEYSGDALVRHMVDAVRGYLCGLAQEAPLVVVLEDLHWADEASLGLLENIADIVTQHPLLLIGLLRPDKDSSAWAAAERARAKLPAEYVTDIALEPLSTADSQELLGTLLHIEELPERVRALILEKSEGNPFYVEEVIRALMDGGQIVREAGRWRATREIEQVAIPNSLAGLLAARIDALPDEAKRLAQLAAVVGRSFAFRVIENLAAVAPPAERIAPIEPPLEWLTREEIVREQAREPELEYAFKHALTQEAAYNSLLLRRRRELHGRAGQALQVLYANRLEEFAATLAYHFWQAEAWQAAANYAIQAGQAAQKVYALREAIHQYEQALEALDKVPNARDEQVYDALIGWAKAAVKFRHYSEQLKRLVRAEQIARRLNDRRRLAEALHAIGAVHLAGGHSLLAFPVLNEAFALAEELGDEALATVPSFHAAFITMDSDPQASLPMFDRTLELARRYGERDLQAYALSAKGMALGRLGRFEESQVLTKQARDLVKTGLSPVTESDVELFSGWAALDMGNGQAAMAHGQRCVEQATATDNFDCICSGYACVGFAHLQLQQLPEAAELFERGVAQTKKTGALLFEVLATGGLALAQLASGQPAALAQLEQAAARALELHDTFTNALFAQAAAEVRLAQGDLATARRYLDPVLAYYRSNNMRPYRERAEAIDSALAAAEAAGTPANA